MFNRSKYSIHCVLEGSAEQTMLSTMFSQAPHSKNIVFTVFSKAQAKANVERKQQWTVSIMIRRFSRANHGIHCLWEGSAKQSITMFSKCKAVKWFRRKDTQVRTEHKHSRRSTVAIIFRRFNRAKHGIYCVSEGSTKQNITILSKC